MNTISTRPGKYYWSQQELQRLKTSNIPEAGGGGGALGQTFNQWHRVYTFLSFHKKDNLYICLHPLTAFSWIQ